MNNYMLLLIFLTSTAEYFVALKWLPHPFKYVPEVMAAMLLLVVVVLGARNRFRYVRPAYWLAFGSMALCMVCSAIINHVDAGPLFAGLRNYLRAIPFFFLPTVYLFTEAQIRSQLKLLTGLCLIQGPIAIYQRMHTLARGNSTGDATAGTLVYSGLLSIFLVCSAGILTAFMLRKRIAWQRFLPLFLLMIFPTTINETKVTVFILPLCFMIVFLAGSPAGLRFKNAIVALFLLVMFGSIFVPIYDYLAAQGHGHHNPPITEFLSNEHQMGKYMDTGAGIGAAHVGRIDALRVPFQEIAKDPVHFGFGFGIGNAYDSALGPQFKGRYFYMFKPFLITAASLFMLEIGMLGIALLMMLYFLIYRDSRVVAEVDRGFFGAFAVGWSGAVAVITVTTFYSGIDISLPISYFFWFYSGLVASRRMQLAAGEVAPVPA